MDIKISPSKDLSGHFRIPGSKSQTLRALFSALLARGTSIIDFPLDSEDTEAMIGAIESFGARVVWLEKQIVVHSPGIFRLKPPDVCQVKSSGITLRFMAALASILKRPITFRGSESLERQRSIKDLEEGLQSLGVKTQSNHGFCPLKIQGPIRTTKAFLQGKDSQPVSALLWTLSALQKKSTLHVRTPSEKPWVDLTLHWLEKQNKVIVHRDHRVYRIMKARRTHPFYYQVPPDFSSLSFMLGAALIAGKKVQFSGLDFHDKQGDKALIYQLKKAGALIDIRNGVLSVSKIEFLNLIRIDCEGMIDAVPILAALAPFSKNRVELIGALGARGKESDRLKSMTSNLRALGIKVEEKDDGLEIDPGIPKGGICESYEDHRVAMATAILALRAENPVILHGAEAINKTYPTFFEDLKSAGAFIEWL